MDYINKLNAYREREIEVLNNLDLNSVNQIMNILCIINIFNNRRMT